MDSINLPRITNYLVPAPFGKIWKAYSDIKDLNGSPDAENISKINLSAHFIIQYSARAAFACAQIVIGKKITRRFNNPYLTTIVYLSNVVLAGKITGHVKDKTTQKEHHDRNPSLSLFLGYSLISVGVSMLAKRDFTGLIPLVFGNVVSSHAEHCRKNSYEFVNSGLSKYVDDFVNKWSQPLVDLICSHP